MVAVEGEMVDEEDSHMAQRTREKREREREEGGGDGADGSGQRLWRTARRVSVEWRGDRVEWD